LLQPSGPEFAAAVVDHRLDDTAIVDEVTRLQLVQGLGQLARCDFVRLEFALQLSARMLALTQQLQGPTFE
jgi:hypothetical protein